MTPSGKVALMVVEDDDNIRFLIEAAARRSGLFEPIVAAPDGQAALDQLHACDGSALPHLIVSDLSMPRLSGLELVRGIKADERLRNIPVAILTSSDAPDDRERALAAGASSFIHKPYGVEALTHALIAIRTACDVNSERAPAGVKV